MDDGWAPSGKRGARAARCEGCRLLPGRCICVEMARIAVRTRVVVLMHRNERLKTTNTGRLAGRVLEGAEVRVRGALPEPPDAPVAPLPEGRRLLLFPAEGAAELSRAHATSDPVVLLVPDGSWSQARKLARRDGLLRGAEPVRLPPCPPSRYVLRRNGREGTLCTIEAIAGALALLGDEPASARLLDVFEAFQARALATRGLPELPLPSAPFAGSGRGSGRQP